MHNLRILFILKRRENTEDWGDAGAGPDYSRALSSGLRNSVGFMVRMLTSMGVEARMDEVPDNNSIDRAVRDYRPTHVIIEAFWVVPEKFDVLMPLHPDVHWAVRNHSETPFLANEGIAFGWAAGYLRRNVEIMCNAPRAVGDMIEVARAYRTSERLVTYAPNHYPIEEAGPMSDLPLVPRASGVLEIGCFGAVRPLKNHMTQAIAALAFSRARRSKLRFHINGGRVEGKGEPILKNLRELFAACPQHELVEHPWTDHAGFLGLLRSVDVAMQVSFSETFNIVAADAAACGVPLVVSRELPWIGDYAHADPTSVDSMVAALHRAVDGTDLRRRLASQRRDLAHYCSRSREIWSERFRLNALTTEGSPMLLVLLIVLILFACGGFGHTGYRRGWYGGAPAEPISGGFGGMSLGVFLLAVVVLLLLFGHGGW